MVNNKPRLQAGYFCSFFCLLTLLLVNLNTAFAQSTQQDSINRKRLNTIIIGTTVAYSASMITLNNVWYSNYDHQPFTFFNDSKEWLQVDKMGHFYSAFQLSGVGSHILGWADVPERKADKVASLASFLLMGSIEIFDGHSAGYGASASDLLANALGSGFYLGQKMLWKEIRIHPKFSFHQTYLADQRPGTLGMNFGEQLIKDYNGQTYWLSLDMDKFVSFPKWINFAFGYGAQNQIYATMDSNLANGYEPYRQFYMSLDFDLTAIKTNSKGLKTLFYILNMIKLPSPTLEFSQGKIKSHAFYF